MALASTLRDLVHALDPQLPVIGTTTMERILEEHVASRRLLMILLTVFAGVALVLALIGIYGVMAHAVSQRTNEIGVRMALGAQRVGDHDDDLARGGAAGPGRPGLGVGVALAGHAAARGRVVRRHADRPSTYVVVVALMLAVGLIACYLPARRAARIDPLSAIRTE